MNVKEINEKYGRQLLIGVVLLIWGVIIWSIFSNGYLETWSFWKISALLPPFLDFRLIPGSAATFQIGIDPAVSNPGDPYQRLFNYPKIWYFIFNTGISQEDTIWICIALLILSFLVIFAFPDRLRVYDLFIFLPIIFSPASVLLYERGNVDLIFFILCGSTILVLNRRPIIAMVILLIASFFKLFPFFGVAVLLDEDKRKFYKFLLPTTAVFLAYIAFNLESLRASWVLTQRGTFTSYGVYIIFEMLQAYVRYYLLRLMPEHQIPIVMEYVPHLLAFLVFMLAFFLGIKSGGRLATSSERDLATFRMGAAVYVGTFLLGNNWDYRLAFLIFTAPQLAQWLFDPASKQRGWLMGILAVLLASCWSTVIIFYYAQFVGLDHILYVNIFDEVMNWLLFAGLAYLLVVSAPQWFRSFSWLPSFRE